MSKEDSVPQGYKYSWSKDSDISLQDFLTKFKPSMVQNDGTKPWIWVRGADSPKDNDAGNKEAKEEALKLLKEVTEKVEDIKNDDSIPVRSNKKTGAKSKKEVREQVQAEATDKFKEISQNHEYLIGKWLMFASADKVDHIWSGIATSLVSGPLHETSAFLAKVSTSPENETLNNQHLICVYMPNVYDKEKVAEVMKILLRNHGVNLSGVKSDLYTSIGLDSKHPSGIPSTVWKNTAILPDKEIKELKDAFFAGLSADKPAVTEGKSTEATGVLETEKPVPKSKAKPKLKKKAQDDFFASDDEDTKEIEKKSVGNPKKRGQSSEDEDEESQPKKKKTNKK